MPTIRSNSSSTSSVYGADNYEMHRCLRVHCLTAITYTSCCCLWYCCCCCCCCFYCVHRVTHTYTPLKGKQNKVANNDQTSWYSTHKLSALTIGCFQMCYCCARMYMYSCVCLPTACCCAVVVLLVDDSVHIVITHDIKLSWLLFAYCCTSKCCKLLVLLPL
jgi:hypothetical protein